MAAPPAITYRRATEADLPALCVLGQMVNLLHHEAHPTLFAPASAPERDDAHWRRSVSLPHMLAYLAECDGEPVGFITAGVADETHSLMQPVRYAWVGTVGVQPAYRGAGVGRTLMTMVEQWAVAQQAVDLRLMVWAFNQHAIRLYEELGFEARMIGMGKPLPSEPRA